MGGLENGIRGAADSGHRSAFKKTGGSWREIVGSSVFFFNCWNFFFFFLKTEEIRAVGVLMEMIQ